MNVARIDLGGAMLNWKHLRVVYLMCAVVLPPTLLSGDTKTSFKKEQASSSKKGPQVQQRPDKTKSITGNESLKNNQRIAEPVWAQEIRKLRSAIRSRSEALFQLKKQIALLEKSLPKTGTPSPKLRLKRQDEKDLVILLEFYIFEHVDLVEKVKNDPASRVDFLKFDCREQREYVQKLEAELQKAEQSLKKKSVSSANSSQLKEIALRLQSRIKRAKEKLAKAERIFKNSSNTNSTSSDEIEKKSGRK